MTDLPPRHTQDAMSGPLPSATPEPSAAPSASPAHAVPAHWGARERAMARLGASRLALAETLMPPKREDFRDAPGAGAPVSRRMAAYLRYWRARWRDTPWSDVTAHVVSDWWQRHPWRPAAEMVADQGRQVALPLVRRHPYLTVGAVTLATAALFWTKPWRATWLAPHARKLSRHATRSVWSLISSLPINAILTTGMSLWATQRAAQATDRAADATQDAAAAADAAVAAGPASPASFAPQSPNLGPAGAQAMPGADGAWPTDGARSSPSTLH